MGDDEAGESGRRAVDWLLLPGAKIEGRAAMRKSFPQNMLMINKVVR